MSVVLAASALLAILFEERGGDVALAVARGAHLYTVNLIEVLAKVARKTGSNIHVLSNRARLEIRIIPFDERQAQIAAGLKQHVGKNGSLADRACLALALDRSLPVICADGAWANLDFGIDIRLIR